MTDPRPPRKAPRPLDPERLQELAVAYVGRFATTRAKLMAYLQRKLRERGWDGAAPPAIEALADKLVRLGYVDDAAFAVAKARSLTQRGFGGRRVGQALHQAGIGEEDGAAARQLAADGSVAAAVRFAERRRLGPFAREPLDPKQRDRALAALLRAGHSFDLARQLLQMPPNPRADASSVEQFLNSV